MATISTIILKPTKFCNASCSYCAAPPEVNGAAKWTIDQFRHAFDKLAPHLTGRAVIIWHGGEPLLMGPEFYRAAWEHARAAMPHIQFSVQSNILGYDSRRWRDVFSEVFQGSVSTSFDPDERHRVYKGSAELYSRLFFERLERILDDGFVPKVIGTYTDETAHLGMAMYERSLSCGDRAFNLRFNYRYPAGRDGGRGELISPEAYGGMIVGLYDRWIRDVPRFTVTPLDEMLKKVIGTEAMRCPWTSACGGRFLGIEPNGDVYNCSEFADTGDERWSFGNIFADTVPGLMRSRAAAAVRRRRVGLPAECLDCRHFQECEGGCMRDAVLFGKGLGGKFHYCLSWKAAFDRIKESVRTGEADAVIRMYGADPDAVRARANLHPGEGRA